MGKHQITERDIKKHEEKDVIDPAGFRVFDTSFFFYFIEILYLSHSWLIFLSNFVILYVLFCAFCVIIE